MPTPSTAKWPKPRGDDEFEDMAVDFLRVRWRDPHAMRNGRRGQRQDGVDVKGRPQYLDGRVAGAQCKNTDRLSWDVVLSEVERAKGFEGGLGEFLVVTTADRDTVLQTRLDEYLKAGSAPFPVVLAFWQDVIADLSTQDSLVAKHWKGFAPGAAMTVNISTSGGAGGPGGAFSGGGGGGGAAFGGAGGTGGQAFVPTPPAPDKDK